MFWQEDDTDKTVELPDDVVDVLFSIECKRLPVDHAYDLSVALKDAVPWLAGDSSVGVHTIHVAGSQNGWERPSHGTDQELIVSRRTKLTLRVPKARMDGLVAELRGKTLKVGRYELTIGDGKPRPLSKEATLFARYVVTRPGDSEEAFLGWVADELHGMGIRLRKALCGKETPLATPDGTIHTRSLMVADLSVSESVRLQERGLGPRRDMGCGIFIPHKGIDAVQKAS